MKKTLSAIALLCICHSSFAQKDSIFVNRDKDTISLGGIIILKKGNPEEKNRITVTLGKPQKNRKNSNLTTHSLFLDLGFANWTDNTDYQSATSNSELISRPGSSAIGSKDFKLRAGKSSNVNIWLIGQRLNLANHQFNLKYALGFEIFNYRFKSNLSFSEGGFNPYDHNQDIAHAFIYTDSVSFSKNKLVTKYLTIPVMLNFRSNPEYSNRGVNLSAGVSFGYLIGSRTKQKSSERGKQKNRGDFDLERWKFAYVGEIGIGSINLYGTYSPKSLFRNELNFQPYAIGLRFSNW
ncbi:MAG: PorT family protein [Chitinophagaceae bacterium]|nr:PorT family protein [Chitinophagaceae bacterium]